MFFLVRKRLVFELQPRPAWNHGLGSNLYCWTNLEPAKWVGWTWVNPDQLGLKSSLVWGCSVNRGTSLSGSISFDGQTSVPSSFAGSLDGWECMVSVECTSDIVAVEVSIVTAYCSRIQFNVLIMSTYWLSVSLCIWFSSLVNFSTCSDSSLIALSPNSPPSSLGIFLFLSVTSSICCPLPLYSQWVWRGSIS